MISIILSLLLLIACLYIWWLRYDFTERFTREQKTGFMSLSLEKERASHCEVDLAATQERLADVLRTMVPKSQLTEALDLSSNLEAEVSRLTNVYNLARESHSTAMQELDALRRTTVPTTELETASAARDEAQARVESLSAELSQLKAAEERLRTESQRLGSTLAEKEKSLADTQSALTTAEQSLQSTRASLMLKEGEVEKTSRELEQAAADLEETRAALTALRSNHDSLDQEHQSLQASHVEREKSLAEKDQALSEKEAAHVRLLAELDDVRSALAEKGAAFEAKDQAHTKVMGEFDELRTAFDNKQSTLQEREQALVEKDQALAEKEAARAQLLAELEDVRSALAEKGAALDAKDQAHTKVLSEFDELRAAFDNKQSALQEREQAHTQVLAEFEDLRVALTAKHSTLEEREAAHATVLAELEDLRLALQAKDNAIADQEKAQAQVRAELDDLQRALADKSSALEAQQEAHAKVLAEFEELRAALADKDLALEEKTQAHSAAVNELHSTKHSLTERIAEVAAAGLALTQAKDVFGAQEQTLRSEAEHLRHVLSDKEKSWAAAQSSTAADLKRHEAEAAAAQRELVRVQQKLAETAHALTAHQESSNHLREQLETNRNNIRAELEQTKSDLAAREQALQEIRDQQSATAVELARLQKELSSREQALAATQRDLSLKEQSLASIKAEVAEKERAINEVQAATLEITRGFEAEAEQAQNEIKRLSADVSRLKAEHQKAEAERVRLAADFDSHRAKTVPQEEHAKLRSSLSETQNRVSLLDTLAATLRGQLGEMQASHVPASQLQAATSQHQQAIAELSSKLQAAETELAEHQQKTQAELAELRANSTQARQALVSAQSAATDAARWLLERLGVSSGASLPSPAESLLPTPAPIAAFAAIPLLPSEHDNELSTVLTSADRSDISGASQQLAPEVAASPANPEQAQAAAEEAVLEDKQAFEEIIATQQAAATSQAEPDYLPPSLMLDEDEEEADSQTPAPAFAPSEAAEETAAHARSSLAAVSEAIHALAHSPVAPAAALGLVAATVATTSAAEPPSEESTPALAQADNPSAPSSGSYTGPSVEAESSSSSVKLYPIGIDAALSRFEPDSVAWDGELLRIAARGEARGSAGKLAGVWCLKPGSRVIESSPAVSLQPSEASSLAPMVVNGTGIWIGATGDGIWHQSPEGQQARRFSEAQGLPNARPNRAAIVGGQTFFGFAAKEGSAVLACANGQDPWRKISPPGNHAFGSVANLLACGDWLAIVEHAGTIGRGSRREEFLHLYHPGTGQWKLITPALQLASGALMGATTASADGSALWLQIRTPAPGWEQLGRNTRPTYSSKLVKLALDPANGEASIAATAPITLPEAYIILHHDGSMLWVATSKKLEVPQSSPTLLYDAEVRAFDSTTLAPRGHFRLPTRAGVGALASSDDTLWLKTFTSLPNESPVPLYALNKAELGW